MSGTNKRKITLGPRLGERLQRIYRLPMRPTTLDEYIQIGKEMVMNNLDGPKYIEAIRSGNIVVGETDEKRGYSIDKEGRRVNVSCAYDALHTAVIRGDGLIKAACPHCGEKMEVKVKGSRVIKASPPSVVYWLGAPSKKAPGNPICDHLHLFPNNEHLKAWVETQLDELGIELPVKEAAEYYARVS